MRAWWAAVPLAWAVLLLFHPVPDPGDIYGSLSPSPEQWLAVHVGTLFFIGLLGAAVIQLVAGLKGAAATISRVAAGAFILCYGAAEAILGIAVGVLVRYANGAPEGDRPAVARAIQALWDDVLSADLAATIGAIGWAVAVIAAAAALWQAGARPLVPVLLVLSSVVLLHAPPIGPIGLILFAAALLLSADTARQAAMTASRGR